MNDHQAQAGDASGGNAVGCQKQVKAQGKEGAAHSDFAKPDSQG